MTRAVLLYLILILTLLSCNSIDNRTKGSTLMSLYSISLKSITGNPVSLGNFKGKKILFVNVASECGYTPQYAELQELHEKYNDKLEVIGLPCNQFGGQEPGTHEEIRQFCMENYGVSFLITEKIQVKGEGQHPLYAWLTNENLNGVDNSSVQWNFQKYLIDEEGNYIDVFYSMTNPLSEEITQYLN